MKTIEAQPEFLNEKCICRSTTTIFEDGEVVSKKDKIESLTFSGYNRTESAYISKIYDVDGILKSLTWESGDIRQIIEYDKSGEEIANTKRKIVNDSDKKRILESNTDMEGNVLEKFFSYNCDNEVIRVTSLENGKAVHFDCLFDDTEQTEKIDDVIAIVKGYDLDGKLISRRVLTEAPYYYQFFVKVVEGFLTKSADPYFENELIKKLYQAPHSSKIFTEDHYDAVGELREKTVCVANSLLFPIVRLVYSPESDKTNLFFFKLEDVSETCDIEIEFERDLIKGVLSMEKITYRECSEELTM